MSFFDKFRNLRKKKEENPITVEWFIKNLPTEICNKEDEEKLLQALICDEISEHHENVVNFITQTSKSERRKLADRFDAILKSYVQYIEETSTVTLQFLLTNKEKLSSDTALAVAECARKKLEYSSKILTEFAKFCDTILY